MERAHVDAFDSLLEMHSMRPKYIYIYIEVSTRTGTAT